MCMDNYENKKKFCSHMSIIGIRILILYFFFNLLKPSCMLLIYYICILFMYVCMCVPMVTYKKNKIIK